MRCRKNGEKGAGLAPLIPQGEIFLVCLFAVAPEPGAPSWVRMCSSEQAALPLWGSLGTHSSPPSLVAPLHLCSTTCKGETYPQGCLLLNSPGTEPIHPPICIPVGLRSSLTAELCFARLLAGVFTRAAAISGHVSAAKREASPDPLPPRLITCVIGCVSAKCLQTGMGNARQISPLS